MLTFRLRAVGPSHRVRCSAWLLVAVFLQTACGGKSATKIDAGASGGTVAAAAGNGGAFASGGSTSTSSGGTSNDASTESGGVAGSALDCNKVVCSPIPTTCKRIVQKPGDCCPTCPDTGCDACAPLTCASGSHSDTLPGDCCPSCVPDPPDACVQGQHSYADMRAALVDKYGSAGCQNSADCSLLLEDNACAYTCNVALPTSLSSDFVFNLKTAAATDCSTCAAPSHVTCAYETAACVNGKCVGVAPP